MACRFYEKLFRGIRAIRIILLAKQCCKVTAFNGKRKHYQGKQQRLFKLFHFAFPHQLQPQRRSRDDRRRYM